MYIAKDSKGLYCAPCPEQNKRWIDEAFGAASSVEEIVGRLEGMVVPSPARPGRGEWAQTALDSLAKASPTALKACNPHSYHFSGAKNPREFERILVNFVLFHAGPWPAGEQ